MEIPVVFATDKKYLFYTLVAITSMAENASKDTRYKIYILVSGELEQGHYLFEEAQHKYTNIKIKLLPVDQNEFRNVTINNTHITKATFYRLLLSELLKENKCLYLDSDIIVTVDLEELFSTNLGDAYIAGVRDLWIDLMDDADRELRRIRTNIPSMAQYVNAGVLLFNLERMREMHMEDLFRNHLDTDYLFEDQDILNVCCYGHIWHLAPKWNIFTCFMGQVHQLREKGISLEVIQQMQEQRGILHYATLFVRPWKSRRFWCNDVWWHYADIWSHTAEYIRLKESVSQREIGYSEDKLITYCLGFDSVYIWGFTAVGRALFNLLESAGVDTVVGFIDMDADKQKFTYSGKSVIAFDLKIYQEGMCAIVIASQKQGEAIRDMLMDMGVREKDIVCYILKDSSYDQYLRPDFVEGEEGHA